MIKQKIIFEFEKIFGSNCRSGTCEKKMLADLGNTFIYVILGIIALSLILGVCMQIRIIKYRKNIMSNICNIGILILAGIFDAGEIEISFDKIIHLSDKDIYLFDSGFNYVVKRHVNEVNNRALSMKISAFIIRVFFIVEIITIGILNRKDNENNIIQPLLPNNR